MVAVFSNIIKTPKNQQLDNYSNLKPFPNDSSYRLNFDLGKKISKIVKISKIAKFGREISCKMRKI